MYRYKIGVSVRISKSFFKQVKKRHIKKSEIVYHGCSKRNIDGTNRLIKKRDLCSKPTNILFSMSTQDAINSVKTQHKNEIKKISKK